MKDEARKKTQTERLKWRWEFMRQNQGYREAYKEALRLREMAPIPPEERHFGGYPYLETEEGKVETALAKSWGHLGVCMVNPDISFDDLMAGPDCMEKAHFLPTTFWSHYLTYDLNTHDKTLTIKIDLSKVNNYGTMKSEVKKLFDLLFSVMLATKSHGFHREKLSRKYFAPGGRELRSSKEYYDIWLYGTTFKEMKMADKRATFKELARKLEPRRFKEDPEGSRKKAESAFHEYERLTNGAYHEITYP